MKIQDKSLLFLQPEKAGKQIKEINKSIKNINQSYKKRERDTYETMTAGIKKSAEKIIEHRNLLEQITKTPEYLELKTNTIFGKKGYIP